MKKPKKESKPHLVKPLIPKPEEAPAEKPAYEQVQEEVRGEEKASDKGEGQ